MYEYKFVEVKLKNSLAMLKPKENYQEIVHQHAAEGWRLVQIFAPSIAGYGTAAYYELIFEKPAEA